MSGLKPKNKRKRPHKNTMLRFNGGSPQQVDQTMRDLKLREPLSIIKIAKPQENKQQQDTEDHSQQHNTINSDNNNSLCVELSRLPRAHFTSLEKDQTTNELYKRPENHYVHYSEPSDIELYELVEYDMDEQDQYWLNMYNTERKKQVLDDISPYLFELIMDKLEKEWFNMINSVTKHHDAFPEDSACAVCDDTEVENSNAIVFCDGCNVAVHQDCYGIPYIPEGQWLCRKCMISPQFPVACLFCPNEGGAFKQTNTNQWGHLLCAIWIPELGVSNPIYMEPIDSIENIPKNRWKLTCSLCRKRQGACIQCDDKHCFAAFHVTCAKAAGLCMRMNSQHTEGVFLKAYCDKHTPTEYHTIIQSTTRGRGRGRGRGRPSHNTLQDNKIARAHQLCYSTGVPIVPDAILSKIDNLYCVKISGVQKRQQLVTAIAHYWSLKRESRRGAPLLKRLHLEPWTASTKYNGDLLSRKSFICQLRSDLDKVRMLSEQVQKRERLKLERTKKQTDYLQMILFPVAYFTQPLLNQFMNVDRKKYFMNPVTQEEAPDYHKMIKHPMCFMDIQNKLTLGEYTFLDQFESDIELIWRNAMTYNASHTGYYKSANKLKMAAKKSFTVARATLDKMELLEDGTWNEPIDPSIFTFDEEAVVPDIPHIELETEQEKQERLEREKLQAEEKRRIVQRRLDGRARAKAIREENKRKGIEQPRPQKVVRNLRSRQTKEQVSSQSTEVTDLRVQQSNTNTDYHTPPLPIIQDTPDLVATNMFQPELPTSHKEVQQNIPINDKDASRKRQRSTSPNSTLQIELEKKSKPYKDKPQAPIGWVYLDDKEQMEDRAAYGSKRNFIRQSRNGVPIPNFQRGDIIWARVDRYPSHPAKFLNYSDEEAGSKLTSSRRYHGDILVEFLKVPEMHRFGWVGRRTICKLGDSKVDKQRLSEALQKRPRRNIFIQEAKEGYQYAAHLLGLDTELILQNVFNSSKTSKKRQHKKT